MPPTINSLVIDGTPIGKRFVIKINGRMRLLRGKALGLLVRLCCARLGGFFLTSDDLEPSRACNSAKYMWREIKKEAHLPYRFVRGEGYELDIDPKAIEIRWENLKLCWDAEIRELANRLADPN